MDDESDLAVVEEAGVAFDPTTQHLNLSKEEKRRTTALMLSIQAYRELIIKEAAYLKEAADLARRDEGLKLRPATIDGIVAGSVNKLHPTDLQRAEIAVANAERPHQGSEG